MMMKNMKKISLAVIAISTAMLSTSCLREENFGKADSKFISLKVSTEGIAETKAGHVAEPLEVVDLSQDGLDLFLYGSVKVNKMSPFGPSTKATKPYESGDESEVTTFDIKMNGIQGYADRSKGYDFWYIYRLGTEEKLTWESETDPSEYLAYYPENVKGATTNVASFASSSTINYVGDGTKDFLVAYTKHSHDHANYPVSDDKYVSLTFKHPLALVKFKVVSTEAKPITVDKIVVNNAGIKGTINGETLETEITTTGEIEAKYNEEEGVYSCYIMPDEIGPKGLNVTFYVNGTILTTKALGTSEWKAGMVYNYTLADANAESVEIDLDENATKVTNEFTTAVYLRAAIIANWVDATGRIVDDAAPTLTLAEGWELNDEDGYYYYKDPVIGYQTADLISNIVPGSSDDDGAENLQVAVAVQAVEYDSIKTAKEAFAALNN